VFTYREKSTPNRLSRFLGVLLLAGVAPCYAASEEPCFQTLAATRDFSLGAPRHTVPAPDGKSVYYLRSGPRDTTLGLYQYVLDRHQERALARPSAAPEHLSTEEKARRERARMTLTGITDFALSDDGKRILVSQADQLSILDMPGIDARKVPGSGWIAPRLSPDGSAIVAVRDNDVHVVDLASGHDTQLTTGGTDVVTHGLAEFAAAEELERLDGTWWSPDGTRLVYEEADSTGVEKHFIADPEHPSVQPTEFRYPRAGTPNAVVRLGIIARSGGKTTWIDWDRGAYPYVARVIWPKRGALSLVLFNREQTEEVVLAVDPDTGKTTRLLTDKDPAWLNLNPDYGLSSAGAKKMPFWLADGKSFLWAAERGAQWQLELHHADGSLDHAVTPQSIPLLALNDVNEADGSVVFTGRPDRLTTAAYRIKLAGGEPQKLTPAPGLHNVSAGEDQHTILADWYALADGGAGTAVLDVSGKLLATLPSFAEHPARGANLQFTTAGPQDFDAVVIRPHDFKAGRRYPVVLSVYGGPTVKLVLRAQRLFLEDQCLADQGFVVATLDGRGTPGRDHDFERATKFDLIDLPLQDQIEGLKALGKRFPEMDMSRVGITGWSFGGYFTAMATIRHPEIFRAGVAGAPVVDYADYDTAYTERYLGLPQQHPEAYKVSNVLTYAANLSRPLLIMHGLTDDNVYFENTVKLTQALIAAGKPYNLLLLPGTHQLPDPKLRARVGETRAAFLREHLGK
jgi:dipeptidyl-peptidase-4